MITTQYRDDGSCSVYIMDTHIPLSASHPATGRHLYLIMFIFFNQFGGNEEIDYYLPPAVYYHRKIRELATEREVYWDWRTTSLVGTKDAHWTRECVLLVV